MNKYLRSSPGADAAKTLAAFSATVRDEVERDRLTAELVSVVNETMQPKTISLWP